MTRPVARGDVEVLHIAPPGHRAFSRAGHTAKLQAVHIVDDGILIDGPIIVPLMGFA